MKRKQSQCCKASASSDKPEQIRSTELPPSCPKTLRTVQTSSSAAITEHSSIFDRLENEERPWSLARFIRNLFRPKKKKRPQGSFKRKTSFKFRHFHNDSIRNGRYDPDAQVCSPPVNTLSGSAPATFARGRNVTRDNIKTFDWSKNRYIHLLQINTRTYKLIPTTGIVVAQLLSHQPIIHHITCHGQNLARYRL